MGSSDLLFSGEIDTRTIRWPRRRARRRTQSRPQYWLVASDDSGLQMLPNVHVGEHGDDEWALPSSYVSVDDENDPSIHATESSADEDDPLAVEEEAVNAMDTGISVARRPKGVSVARLRNTPAPALETTTSLSMAVVSFAPL